MKHRLIRNIALMLLLATAMFFGCTPEQMSEPDASSGSTAEGAPSELHLVEAHETEYVIVIPTHAKKYVRSTAKLLADAIEAYTGAVILVCEDSDVPESGTFPECEILFGLTNRPEQAESNPEAYAQGYAISVKNRKLLFDAETQSGLYLAVCRFVQDVFGPGADPEHGLPEAPIVSALSLPGGYAAVEKLPFALFPFLGYPISDYRVVYRGGSLMQERYAHRISETVRTLAGKPLAIAAAPVAEGGVQLVVEERTELPRGEFEITVRENRITLAASTYYGFEGIFRYLETAAPNGYYPFREGFSFRGSYLDSLTSLTESTRYAYLPAGNLRIMSYNVLWGQPDIAERNRLQAEMIAQYRPDVLGLQECDFNNRLESAYNIITLLESLGYRESISPAIPDFYRRYNVCPILYNTATTELVRSGYHIYENQQSGSETRMLSWAVLRDKTGKGSYVLLNTHLEGGNAAVGLGQVQEIETIIAGLLQEYPKLPVFLIGDFNFNRSSPTFAYLADTAGYRHARDLATEFVSITNSTHSAPVFDTLCGMMQPGGNVGYDNQGQNSIDQIFLAAGGGEVRVYGCVADECTRSGSDHFPVFIDYVFESATELLKVR